MTYFEDKAIEQAKQKFIYSGAYPEEFGLLTEIMYKGGSRPRAILALTGRNCTTDGMIIIPQGKGSRTIAVWVSIYIKLVQRVAGTDKPLFKYLDYYAYRRACLREGVMFKRRGYQYANVCSLFRERMARVAEGVRGATSDASDVVGHKSQKSTAHYLGRSREEVRERVKQQAKK